jgi:hypothetical protein
MTHAVAAHTPRRNAWKANPNLNDAPFQRMP